MFDDVNDTLSLIMESITNDTDDSSTYVFRGSNIGKAASEDELLVSARIGLVIR